MRHRASGLRLRRPLLFSQPRKIPACPECHPNGSMKRTLHGREKDMDGQLLLRAPSTRPNDMAISLRAPAGCPATADEMARLAIGSSCPPAVAERVRSCILHSGRYDCRVTPSAAFFLSAKQTRLMEHFGGSVTLTELHA